MASWSQREERRVINKASANENLRTPLRNFSGLLYLNPEIKWVITYKEDGHLEFFENWDGVAEYDTQQDAASVIGDAKAAYPDATNWKVMRHPLG